MVLLTHKIHRHKNSKCYVTPACFVRWMKALGRQNELFRITKSSGPLTPISAYFWFYQAKSGDISSEHREHSILGLSQDPEVCWLCVSIVSSWAFNFYFLCSGLVEISWRERCLASAVWLTGNRERCFLEINAPKVRDAEIHVVNKIKQTEQIGDEDREHCYYPCKEQTAQQFKSLWIHIHTRTACRANKEK